MKMAGFMPVILAAICACQKTSNEIEHVDNQEVIYKNLPFEMSVVRRPTFSDYTVSIKT